MKKLPSLLLTLVIILSLPACGQPAIDSSSANQTNAPNAPAQTSEPTPTESSSTDVDISSGKNSSSATLGSFNKDATIAETILVDENDVCITATGINYTNYSAELELTIENNSSKDLSFISGPMGYSCNSINGYMVNDGYLNCDIPSGKKANDVISFSYDGLMLYGISVIADMEIGFDIIDKDYNHSYSGPRQIKTSVADSHDYSKEYYKDTITSDAAQNTYDFAINYFAKDKLYEQNGVSVISQGLMVNRDGATILLLEVANDSEQTVFVSTEDISINGLTVYSSAWSSDAINPGKRSIIDIDISSALDGGFWEIYGIREISSVGLSLYQKNEDGDVVAEPTAFVIVVPKVSTTFDANGKEVYSKDGLRIVSKGLAEDSFEYSNDIYVLLLAENNSGATITISDVYGSLSINGYISDYTIYSAELENGESAVLRIKVWESSLEKNRISSLSDITEVEVSFKIKEDWNTLDETTVTINF